MDERKVAATTLCGESWPILRKRERCRKRWRRRALLCFSLSTKSEASKVRWRRRTHHLAISKVLNKHLIGRFWLNLPSPQAMAPSDPPPCYQQGAQQAPDRSFLVEFTKTASDGAVGPSGVRRVVGVCDSFRFLQLPFLCPQTRP